MIIDSEEKLQAQALWVWEELPTEPSLRRTVREHPHNTD